MRPAVCAGLLGTLFIACGSCRGAPPQRRGNNPLFLTAARCGAAIAPAGTGRWRLCGEHAAGAYAAVGEVIARGDAPPDFASAPWRALTSSRAWLAVGWLAHSLGDQAAGAACARAGLRDLEPWLPPPGVNDDTELAIIGAELKLEHGYPKEAVWLLLAMLEDRTVLYAYKHRDVVAYRCWRATDGEHSVSQICDLPGPLQFGGHSSTRGLPALHPFLSGSGNIDYEAPLTEILRRAKNADEVVTAMVARGWQVIPSHF